ncbi:MAG: ATP-binding protein [Tangfeifania sp.]
MSNQPIIRKASGETEPFSQQKLEASLKRAGAGEETIAEIAGDIKSWLTDGESTKNIYTRAFRLLRQKRSSLAARYKLKRAIMELGPSGYPFEHFIGQIMKNQGFEVLTGQVVEGHCITHEMDVIATKDSVQRLVECKFRNSQGNITSVQAPLYVRSRVDDIIKKRKTLPEFQGLDFQGWLVTNTRFSLDAIQYGACSGLNMLSWDYPRENGLKDLIERDRIFPVTTLVNLTKKQKVMLAQNGIVLCRQLLESPEEIDSLGLTSQQRRKLEEEQEELCS